MLGGRGLLVSRGTQVVSVLEKAYFVPSGPWVVGEPDGGPVGGVEGGAAAGGAGGGDGAVKTG